MAKKDAKLVAHLRSVQEAVDKKLGKGVILRLGDADVPTVGAVPTGSYGLDRALGIGGLPRGRIVEVFGPESAGKSTLCLHVVANAQAAGVACAYVDAEHALDVGYARKIGVDIDNLLLSQPDSGEQALDVTEAVVQAGVGVVVVDSVAALTPKAELEGEMGDQHMGLQARLMGQAMRKLTAVAFRHDTLIIFINQLRMKIGVVYGNPETTPGGNALKFYASVRLDVRRIGPLKKGEQLIGNHVRAKVVKNKLAPPFREAEFDIRYGEGIDRASELLDAAVAAGLVEQAGAWFTVEGDRVQGRDAARARVAEAAAGLEAKLAARAAAEVAP